jgi:hypothetical protein
LILLGLAATFILAACHDEVNEPESGFSDLYPADGASGVIPGEPGYGTIDEIPQSMLEAYGQYLTPNRDNSSYWFDFSGN